MLKNWPLWKSAPIALLSGLFLFSGCAFFRQASHDRDWQAAGAVLPRAKVDEESGLVTIYGFRDFRFDADRNVVEARRTTRRLSLDGLDSLWFIKEEFPENRAFAHTMLSFGTTDGDYVAFSVEARKEVGEDYSAWGGLFRKFEVMIQVGSERDLIGQRLHLRESPRIFLYPLTEISEADIRAIFLSLVGHMNTIYEEPDWYHTLNFNCTSILKDHAEQATGRNIPSGLDTMMPGYSDRVLYRLGWIPDDAPLKEIQKRHRLSPEMSEVEDPDFSNKIRQGTKEG